MCRLLIALFIVLSLSSKAQKIPFSRQSYHDSLALSKSIVGLAKRLILLHSNADRITYYNNQFRYQMIAEEYKGAKSSIDSVRKGRGPLAAIQYESYLLACELERTTQKSFGELYPSVLTALLTNLTEENKEAAESYFLYPVHALKSEVYEHVERLKRQNSDSIELKDAEDLVTSYNAYVVYSRIKHHSKKVFKAEENRKYVIQDSVLIKVRNGSVLSAIIVRSRLDSLPKPVVLMYSIYAGEGDAHHAKEAVSHGFVGVVVNTRGKYLSPQPLEPFEHDAEDAYDAIEWISKQSWCNGKIGMHGGSYLGFSQWSAVKNIHPALKTIVPQASVGVGVDYPALNNVFMTYMLRWIHMVNNHKLTDYEEFFKTEKWETLNKRWYTSGRSFRSLDTLNGKPSQLFQRWLNHPSYDSYWCSMIPCKDEFARINIPILTITGYYDDDQLGAMYYFKQHQYYNPKANHYLLIGPYDHSGVHDFPEPYLRGYTLDSVARISIKEIVFDWFDYILNNGSRPSLLTDKINYQVMGTNTWKHSSSLKEMNSDTISFYLSDSKNGNFYELRTQVPQNNKSIRQIIDFKNRSDSSLFLPMSEFLIEDSVLVADGCLNFMSEPLKSAVTVNGSFTGHVNVVINKKDIDLFVELSELLPNGKYVVLSNYLTRASYTKDRSKRVLLKPGKEETIPINNSYFVSKKISAGSRIVVRVGVHKNYAWQINYGTGKDVSDETMADGKIPLKVKWSNTSAIKVPIDR